MKLPRHFVSASAAITAPAQRVMAHVIDVFMQGTAEIVIGVDAAGELIVSSGAPKLTPAARAELSVHELLAPPCLRQIEANELYVLDLDLVEQLADTPGRNDPVYLYGRLFGPIGVTPDESAQGQLTLTRADLLEGFVAAQPWAFRYVHERRCFHAALPAGRDDDIVAGNAIVLAYSLPPPEAWDGVPANEGFVNHLLGDVLATLRADIEREDRDRSVLSKLFTQPQAPELDLPSSLDTHGYLKVSRTALGLFDAWPTRRALELRRRVRAATSKPIGQIIEPEPVIATPQRAPTYVEQLPKEWIHDFVAQHAAKGSKPKVKSPKSSPEASTPEWMKDFK